MNLPLMEYWRELNSYSYEELSELSGVPCDMVQKIFTGQIKELDKEMIQALERVLLPDRPSAASRKEYPEASAARVCETGAVYGVQKSFCTLADYYALPDDRRAELIDGVIYDMSAPSLAHQAVSAEIFSQLRDYIAEKKGKCKVFFAPVDVKLDCDDKTMVQPDILVNCDKEKMVNKCIMGAPDFVIEILSESTRRKDMFLKLHKYEAAGVREYWMVDAEKLRVIVYFFEQDSCPVIYNMGDMVPVGIFGGELLIDSSRIREELKDTEFIYPS